MNKNNKSPFSKVTSMLAENNGSTFSFAANNEQELLLDWDVLSNAIAQANLEDKMIKGKVGLPFRVRPIIGVSSDSYWNLELVRRYISQIENRFISISKIVDLHISSFYPGRSDLDEYEREEIKNQELRNAYDSLRRLIYVKTDSMRMMEFRVPELTNSALPIWRSAMLMLFEPNLVTEDEFQELFSIFHANLLIFVDGKNDRESMQLQLMNNKIDFKKLHKTLLLRRDFLVEQFEKKHKTPYSNNISKYRGSAKNVDTSIEIKEIRKLDVYLELENVEINNFNKRFSSLQEIAKKQGTFVRTKK